MTPAIRVLRELSIDYVQEIVYCLQRTTAAVQQHLSAASTPAHTTFAPLPSASYNNTSPLLPLPWNVRYLITDPRNLSPRQKPFPIPSAGCTRDQRWGTRAGSCRGTEGACGCEYVTPKSQGYCRPFQTSRAQK